MTFTTTAVWLASDPSGDTSGAMLVTLTGAGAGVNDGRSGPGPRTHRSMVYVRTPAADDCGCSVYTIDCRRPRLWRTKTAEDHNGMFRPQ